MPSRDFLEHQKIMMNETISCDSLVDFLHDSSCQLLLLDCRPHFEFVASHIRGAISLTLPASIIMLRRLANGKLSLPSLIKDNEGRERFEKQWKDCTLILYDDNADCVTQSGSCVLSTLLRRLQDERCTVACLQGGFSQFQKLFPEWCESDSETPLPGLEMLRITSSVLDAPESDAGERCDSGLAPTPQDSSTTAPFPVEILPNLFLGNATNSCDLESLERHDIHYILNVTPNLPNTFEKKGLDIKYMQIPIQDHWSQNLASFFPEAIAFIDEARRKKLGVLVHCLAGISRSVTITLAYLMHEMSIPLNDAYDFVRKRKANISPNFNFLGQLKDFERQLNLSPCGCTCLQTPCQCQTLHFMSPTRTTPDSGIHLERWT